MSKVIDDTKDVKHLGQVFTPQSIVSDMLTLMKNNGRVLEPSCGEGAFSKNLPGCVAIEYDKTRVNDSTTKVMDFFDYPINEKFDSIIGNPPYVRYQDILPDTKAKLDMKMFDKRSNLYMFFIHKCVEHLNKNGELIFIVPRTFLKATSSIKLNTYLFDNGTITDIIDLGDKCIFKNASPNPIIFRFEKGNFSRKTNHIQSFNVVNGQIIFTNKEYSIPFSSLFYVKVGAVSGLDNCFENNEGNESFVCSYTKATGKTKRMFYNVESDHLLQHKLALLSRKMKRFNENNWFMWGRNYYKSESMRLYVNAKTRCKDPFFYHPCNAYDGSILAIFPRFPVELKDIKKIADELNNINWEELGFVCDGRFLFSQKSLENVPLPYPFQKYFALM